MIYNIRHATKVKYASPIAHALFNLRLIPWNWAGQTFRNFRLTITPQPSEREDHDGPYCVNTTRIAFRETLSEFDFLSEFEVEVDAPADPGDGPSVQLVRDDALEMLDISVLSPAPYLFASRIAQSDDEIRRWASGHFLPDIPIVKSARALMKAVHDEFTYKPGSTTSATSPSEAFGLRKGVCQDFAHVMIIALRSHGIPAAYASGYLRTNPPPGRPRLVGADAMHAWVNVWCGKDLGWVGFDPTNDCLARFDHIQIGMGRDYADVAPIDGTFVGTAPQQMKTAVDVIEGS